MTEENIIQSNVLQFESDYYKIAEHNEWATAFSHGKYAVIFMHKEGFCEIDWPMVETIAAESPETTKYEITLHRVCQLILAVRNGNTIAMTEESRLGADYKGS
jgi:hypothetical protein